MVATSGPFPSRKDIAAAEFSYHNGGHGISISNGYGSDIYFEPSLQGPSDMISMSQHERQHRSSQLETIMSVLRQNSSAFPENFALVQVKGRYAIKVLDDNGNAIHEAGPTRHSNSKAVFDQLHLHFLDRTQPIGDRETHWAEAELRTARSNPRGGQPRAPDPSRYVHDLERRDVRINGGLNRHRKRRVTANRQPQPQYDDEFANSDGSIDYGLTEPERDTIKTERIRVGDEERCRKFYEKKFIDIQQVPCKAIAKEWIKAIEPKKQSSHPYNGGMQAKEAKKIWEQNGKQGTWDTENEGSYSKPEWWPENVKHKEPDHIKKRDRILLLLHILTQLYGEPWNIRVGLLKQSTKKLVNAQFDDMKGGASPEDMKKWLEDIYMLRTKQEQWLEGGCDGTSSVSFELSKPPPRRAPKHSRGHIRPPRRHRQASPGASEVERSEEAEDESEEEPFVNPTQSPTELTSPVANLELKKETSRMPQNLMYERAVRTLLPNVYAKPDRSMVSMPNGLASETPMRHQGDLHTIQSPTSASSATLYAHNLPNQGQPDIYNGNPTVHTDIEVKQGNYSQPMQLSGLAMNNVTNPEQHVHALHSARSHVNGPEHQNFVSTYGANHEPTTATTTTTTRHYDGGLWFRNNPSLGIQVHQEFAGVFAEPQAASNLEQFSSPLPLTQLNQQTTAPLSRSSRTQMSYPQFLADIAPSAQPIGTHVSQMNQYGHGLPAQRQSFSL